jgi:hypothetical protein
MPHILEFLSVFAITLRLLSVASAFAGTDPDLFNIFAMLASAAAAQWKDPSLRVGRSGRRTADRKRWPRRRMAVPFKCASDGV